MTDTDLSRWIVEKVFKECWHEVYDIVNIGLYHDGHCIVESECTCGKTLSTIWKYDDGDYVRLIESEFHNIDKHVADSNPNLCTPDGSALLKAKAIELGVWDKFIEWNTKQCFVEMIEIFKRGSNAFEAFSDFMVPVGHASVAEILTTPSLFAEAFRAFWIERGK